MRSSARRWNPPSTASPPLTAAPPSRCRRISTSPGSGVTPSVRVAYLHTSVKEEYVYATPTDDDYVGPATILDHTERSGYGVGGALQLEFAEDGTIVTPCVLGQYIDGVQTRHGRHQRHRNHIYVVGSASGALRGFRHRRAVEVECGRPLCGGAHILPADQAGVEAALPPSAEIDRLVLECSTASAPASIGEGVART